MSWNHAGLKDPFNVQAGPVDFSVTGYETFVDMVSDSTRQLIFEKSVLVEFRCNIKEYL